MRVLLTTSKVPTKRSAPCTDLRDASKIVRAFIEEHGIGASDMSHGFGRVVADGKNVGRISYNGRMWVLDDNGNESEVM